MIYQQTDALKYYYGFDYFGAIFGCERMGELFKRGFGERAKDWLIRYIKFNAVGFLVFLIGTAIYAIAFKSFGAWTWLIASGSGGVLQFVLINYVNKTKWGRIFNSCEQKDP